MAADSTVIDRIAARQHGLVTSDQALRALGPRHRSEWIQMGRLVVVQPRVFRVDGAAATWHQSVLAAALSVGGVASHRSAAQVWGLLDQRGFVEVSVRTATAARAEPPAIIHRVADLRREHVVLRDGLPVTDPRRTLRDLRLVLPAAAFDAAARGLAS